MSVTNHLLSRCSLTNVTNMVLALISLVACSAYPQPAPTTTETNTSIATQIVSSTPAQVVPSTMTPIPQPMRIGGFGSGVMSDVFRSLNGDVIAIGIGNTLHWYDSKTFEEIGSLSLNISGVVTIHFSLDGRFVGIEAGLISDAPIVDLGHQKVVATITDPSSFISDLSFTPDNQYVVFRVESINFGDFISLWNLRTNEREHYFAVLNPDQFHLITAPVLSPDGMSVAAGSDKQVYVWDLSSGQRKFMLEWHTQDVTSVAFSPDGKWLAAGGLDHTVRIWDPSTGKRMQVISGIGDEVSSIEFSPDSKQMKINAGGRPAYLWDFNTGKLNIADVQPVVPDPFAVKMHYQGFSQNWLPESSGEIIFSPDGKALALGSEPILVWDLEKQTVVSSLENSRRTFMTDMQYSPNGRWLAALDDLGNLLIWDMQSSKVHKTRGGVRSFILSADSSTLVLAGRTVLEVWDIESDMLRLTIKLSQGTQRVNHVALSSDRNQIYAMLDLNDKKVTQTWDIATGKLLDQFELPERSWMAFSNTDMHWPYFARNNANDTQSWIEIWNLETNAVVSKPQTPTPATEPLQFSPDGKLIMAISKGDLYAWNTITGELAFTLPSIRALAGIAISPDDQTLAIEQLGMVELWDVSQVTKDLANH